MRSCNESALCFALFIFVCCVHFIFQSEENATHPPQVPTTIAAARGFAPSYTSSGLDIRPASLTSAVESISDGESAALKIHVNKGTEFSLRRASASEVHHDYVKPPSEAFGFSTKFVPPSLPLLPTELQRSSPEQPPVAHTPLSPQPPLPPLPLPRLPQPVQQSHQGEPETRRRIPLPALPRERAVAPVQNKRNVRPQGTAESRRNRAMRNAATSRSSVKQNSASARGSSRGGGGGSINVNKARGLGITVLRPNDKTAGRAYDFGCTASQKHSCACQLQCGSSCDNALDLCSSLPGCKFVSISVGNDWATLKRGPTDKEMRLLNIEGRAMTWEDLEAMQPIIRADAASNPMASNMHAFAAVAEDVLLSAISSSNSSLCGKRTSTPKAEMDRILQNKLGIVALSYRTPSTLQNSMKSWKDSGLLSLVSERKAILNDPLPIDVAIAQRHGFSVVEPRKMGAGVKEAKKNVVTIGTAFYHGLAMSSSEYVLFLEKDFKMDVTLGFDEIKRQLLGAVWLLERGISIVRLRSSKEKGCGTFRECRSGANKPNWSGDTTMKRRRNWWSFYCDRDEFEPKVRSQGVRVDDRMAECIGAPKYRCFTSWDSNWSLNAVMVRRDAMLRQKFNFEKKGKPFGTLADYGRKMWEAQDGFEVGLLRDDWGDLRVPICISYDGTFIHEEIDG